MEQTSKHNAIVHLVHGTFAHEADWIQPDSALAHRVKKSLGIETEVFPFQWSGANSHAARRIAGNELAQKIRDFSRKSPQKSQYIIAHSHGGNVASYALSDAEVSSKVAAMVCLGTPFIKAHARDLAGAQRLARWILIASMLVVLIVTMAIFIEAIRLGFNPEMLKALPIKGPPIPDEFLDSSWLPIYLTVSLIMLAGGVGWLFSRPFVWLWRFVDRKALPGLATEQAEIIKHLNAKFRETPLLIVDATGDEAAWWLRSMSRIAAFPYKIWQPSRFMILGMLILCILAGALLFSEASLQKTANSFDIFLLAIPILLFAASSTILAAIGWLLCLLWPACFRSHALGFGRDDFLKNFIVEISATELPEVSSSLHHETVLVKGKGLRHSRLYREEGVLRILGDWLGRQPGAA